MRIAALIAGILTLLLFGCTPKETGGKTRVAVSFEPQAWLLEQIAGDDIDIVTLIPSGSDPENYQPTVGVMKNLAGASAYFSLGTPGFEESMGKNIRENFPGLKVTDTSAGLEKIYGTHADTPRNDRGSDPHVMTSLRNCIQIAESMKRTLVEMNPEKAERYEEGYEKLKDRLTRLDREWSAKKLKGKTIVVRHPMLSYFAKDYGIRQLALEQDGKEPTPLQLSRQIGSIREASPTLAVTDPSGSGRSLIEGLASDLGIKVVEANLDTRDWIEQLNRLADEIDRN